MIAPIESNQSQGDIWVGAQDDKGATFPDKRTITTAKFQIVQG
ncbi:hypothetical protein ABT369_35805 [Dactylosporangium sp. NPDC000244]